MDENSARLVYGDLLEYTDLNFTDVSLDEVSNFYLSFLHTKKSLIECFISYVLADNGFKYDTPMPIEDFDKERWVEEFSGMPLWAPPWTCDPKGEKWNMKFVKNGEKLVVTVLYSYSLGLSVEDLAKKFSDSRDKGKLRIFFAPELSVIKGREGELGSKTFEEFEEELEKLVQWDALLDPQGFLDRFTKSSSEREDIKNRWKNIRDKILNRFEKTSHILDKRGKASAYDTVEDKIGRAKKSFKNENYSGVFSSLRRALIMKLKRRFDIPMNYEINFGKLLNLAKENLRGERYNQYFEQVEDDFSKPRNRYQYNNNLVDEASVSKGITAVTDFVKKVDEMEFDEKKIREEVIPSPPVSEGDIRKIEIENIGDEDDGVAKVGEEDFVVFVPNTTVGDRVKVKIKKLPSSKDFAFAEKIGE